MRHASRGRVAWVWLRTCRCKRGRLSKSVCTAAAGCHAHARMRLPQGVPCCSPYDMIWGGGVQVRCSLRPPLRVDQQLRRPAQHARVPSLPHLQPGHVLVRGQCWAGPLAMAYTQPRPPPLLWHTQQQVQQEIACTPCLLLAGAPGCMSCRQRACVSRACWRVCVDHTCASYDRHACQRMCAPLRI